MKKRRVQLVFALALTIGLGLASRSSSMELPRWVVANAGDALWATCVYWALAMIWPRLAARRLAVLTIVVSFVVELSQLVHVQWLDELRATRVGALLLGQGWQWEDLPRYVAGAVLAWALDHALLRRD